MLAVVGVLGVPGAQHRPWVLDTDGGSVLGLTIQRRGWAAHRSASGGVPADWGLGA